MSTTYVKLTGWVTRDPQLHKTTVSQTAVCTVRVGTANRWPDRTTGEWREGPVSYYDVVCWRGLAENVAASLRKGQMVTVHGSFRNRSWTDKDNNTRTSLEITASSVGHELLYGWSHYNRMRQGSSRTAEELGRGEASRALDYRQAAGDPGQAAESGWDTGPGPRDEDPPRDDHDEDLFRDGAGQREGDPAAVPAYEPDGGRVFGTGDEGAADSADIAEAAADEPRLAEVAVPV